MKTYIGPNVVTRLTDNALGQRTFWHDSDILDLIAKSVKGPAGGRWGARRRATRKSAGGERVMDFPCVHSVSRFRASAVFAQVSHVGFAAPGQDCPLEVVKTYIGPNAGDAADVSTRGRGLAFDGGDENKWECGVVC